MMITTKKKKSLTFEYSLRRPSQQPFACLLWNNLLRINTEFGGIVLALLVLLSVLVWKHHTLFYIVNHENSTFLQAIWSIVVLIPF